MIHRSIQKSNPCVCVLTRLQREEGFNREHVLGGVIKGIWIMGSAWTFFFKKKIKIKKLINNEWITKMFLSYSFFWTRSTMVYLSSLYLTPLRLPSSPVPPRKKNQLSQCTIQQSISSTPSFFVAKYSLCIYQVHRAFLSFLPK